MPARVSPTESELLSEGEAMLNDLAEFAATL